MTENIRVRKALASKGALRVGINMANKLLISGIRDNGSPVGVSPDVGQAIAKRLRMPLVFVPYPSPSAVADAAERDEWDIAHIGAEPKRAETIAFTKAYCEIEATCLVPEASPLQHTDDIDRKGLRIAVKAGAAYGLWLQRNISKAGLMLVDPSSDPYRHFVAQKLDAMAGLRTGLEKDLNRAKGYRLLEGSFMTVRQAVGTPMKNADVLPWLEGVIADLKATGQIRAFIDIHEIKGLRVPPL